VGTRRLALLGLLSLLGCGRPAWRPRPLVLPDDPPPTNLAPSNAVYTVVLDSLGRLFKGSPFLVASSTRAVVPLDAAARVDTFPDLTYPGPESTGPGQALAPEFAARVPVLLVPPGTSLRDHPGAAGVVSFSDVSFNLDSTHALVGVAVVCGGWCGEGANYYLARRPHRAWTVVKVVGLWRS
jgi:hypothetical protein